MNIKAKTIRELLQTTFKDIRKDIHKDANLNFYLRLAGIIFGCGLLAIAISLQTAVSLSKSSEAQTAEKLFRGQLSSLAASFEAELGSERNKLIQVVREKEAKASEKRTRDFTNVVAYTMNGASTALRWNLTNASQATVSAPIAVKLIQDFSALQNNFDFRMIEIANKVTRLALVTSVQLSGAAGKGNEKIVVIGFLEPTVFQEKIDRQKGYVETLAFVDRMGKTVAHSQREYLGRIISLPTDLKIEKNDKNLKTVSGSMALSEFPGKVFASAKLDGLPAAGGIAVFQAALFSMGIFVIGLASALVLLKKREDTLAFLKSSIGLGLTEPRMQLPPIPAAAVALPAPSRAPLPTRPVLPEAAPKIPERIYVAQAAKDRLTIATEISEGFVRELRPHLTTILGQSQLAKIKANLEDTTKYHNSIESEARAAREALEKLTYFSQAENPHPKYRDEAIRLNELIDLSLRPVANLISQQGLQIEKKFASDYFVKGIPAQLEQAFGELIKNAVEASRAKGKIEISTNSTEHGVEIKIRDYGFGFDTKALEHTYEPFVSTKSRDQHKGLGLALAYGVIKSHGGSIQIESQMSLGVTVRITLGVAPKDLKTFAQEKAKSFEFRNDESPLPTEVLRAPAKTENQELSFIEDAPVQKADLPKAPPPPMRTAEPAVPPSAQALKSRLQEDLKAAFSNHSDFSFEDEEEEFVIGDSLDKKDKGRNKVDSFPFSVRKPTSRAEKLR